ncbi:MAG: B12-binding domain-containing radical SAM protein, partial [Burkholderiales bacterium PBB4]
RSLPGAVPELGMVYDAAPPFTVRCTDAVSADEGAAFVRLARYWDLVANSGRFGATMPLVMVCASGSPFAAFAHLSAWLWHTSAITQGKTSGLTPEDLVNALFDYLTTERGLAVTDVRAALVADYVASGARANPSSLQGFLPVREAPQPGSRRALAQRQDLHQHQPIRIDA